MKIKKLIKTISILTLVFFMTISSFQTALAEIPKGYWKYHDPYLKAITDNNEAEILRLCEETINFFNTLPMDQSKADIVSARYRKMSEIYEKQGKYDLAIKSMKNLLVYLEYLNNDLKIDYLDEIKAVKQRIIKIDPMTEIYALTQNTDSIPFFGMKHEPKNGTYIGRPSSADGPIPFTNETVISFYVECLQEKAQDFDYYIGKYADGKRLIHIAFNMPNENDTLKKVLLPEADAYLKETMAYLKSLNTPILLRIGGEMNVWTKLADAETYKKAFIKITKIAREIAPNVATVFSPNDISNWTVDISDYYPGDEYVDWVGVSLYTNKFKPSTLTAGKDSEEMLYSLGKYANPITKLKDIVDRYGSKKPIIITEGGSGHSFVGKDINLTDFAKSRMNILYTYANMLFPQVKGMIYFDVYPKNSNAYIYDLSKNNAILTQYKNSLESNEAFIKEIGVKPLAYVKAENYKDTLSEVELYTYCQIIGDPVLSVTYTLDKKVIQSEATLPYKCVISSKDIQKGIHELVVTVKSGNYQSVKTYALEKDGNGIVTIVKDINMLYANVPNINTASAWARTDIKSAITKGFVPAELQNKYNSNITRAEYCRLAIKYIENKLSKNIDTILADNGVVKNINAFTDTKDADILAAFALGITKGTSEGKFSPNNEITREQAATMVQNACKVLGMDVNSFPNSGFADMSLVSSWAVDAINFCRANEIMGGTGNNNFSPNATYTREQSIITFNNIK
jgi:tetratricopeptide (TPR) repeat protein